jgi:hypothetical protein
VPMALDEGHDEIFLLFIVDEMVVRLIIPHNR